MSGDGASFWVGAYRALETILGGRPHPTEDECETVEQMRTRILSAPIRSETYDEAATACARLILEAWKQYPQLVEVPTEAVYLYDSDGRMVYEECDGAVVLVPGLHDALKQLYRKRPDALTILSDLTGFMWGWACNAALRCIDQPSVKNPAIVEIGT